jgi:hypothetical protein
MRYKRSSTIHKSNLRGECSVPIHRLWKILIPNVCLPYQYVLISLSQGNVRLSEILSTVNLRCNLYPIGNSVPHPRREMEWSETTGTCPALPNRLKAWTSHHALCELFSCSRTLRHGTSITEADSALKEVKFSTECGPSGIADWGVLLFSIMKCN